VEHKSVSGGFYFNWMTLRSAINHALESLPNEPIKNKLKFFLEKGGITDGFVEHK
jgi:hypothetical protein